MIAKRFLLVSALLIALSFNAARRQPSSFRRRTAPISIPSRHPSRHGSGFHARGRVSAERFFNADGPAAAWRRVH